MAMLSRQVKVIKKNMIDELENDFGYNRKQLEKATYSQVKNQLSIERIKNVKESPYF
ncbi:hypothetical protein [Halalkalibacillus sediminis]|uniref:hypothetical protein n=1 Tax=Halalkalibacillus sediminis TaxID=2018042 RepID=UPI0013905C5D|nr:hypothetical protein [Halalkalibacillus sediminis]